MKVSALVGFSTSANESVYSPFFLSLLTCTGYVE